MNAAPELLLTEREAAEALRVTVRTLYALRQAGELPYLRIGRRVLYPADALRAWVAGRCQGGQNRG